MFWLGLDIGTGGSRAILVDRDGKQVAAVTAPHEDMRMEQPLYAEQRPENWWDAAAARHSRRARRGPRHRRANSRHRPLRPDARLRDSRCRAQRHPPRAHLVRSALARRRWTSSTRNSAAKTWSRPSPIRCSPASLCPSCCGCAITSRANFERVRKLLLPKDYIRFQLTGEFATEVSDASGTALLDVVNRRWSHDMMDGLGLDAAILPRVL